MALIDLTVSTDKGAFAFHTLIIESFKDKNLKNIHLLVSTSRKSITLLKISLLTLFFNYGRKHFLLAAF